MVLRFDNGSIGIPEPTQQGGLRIPANLTRVGVLTYRDGAGNQWAELRPPEEVFDESSMASMRGATVTIGHHGKVTPDTFSDISKGHVGDDVHQDGVYVVATLAVNARDAVDAVQSKKLRDVSAGYGCQLEESPGVWEGQEYQRIQRQIRYNHVALLPPGAGRAGTDVSLRMDGAAVQVDDSEKYDATFDDKVKAIMQEHPEYDEERARKIVGAMVKEERGDSAAKGISMKTIKYRDKVYRTDAEQDMAALQSAVDEEKKTDQDVTDIKAGLDAVQKSMADLMTQVAQLQASMVAKEAVAAASQPAAPMEGSPPPAEAMPPEEAVLDAKVEARMALIQDAREVLGDFDHKGKKTADIHRLVIAKLAPELRLDGANEVAVDATYRGAMAVHSARKAEAAKQEARRADDRQKVSSVLGPSKEQTEAVTNEAAIHEDASMVLQKRLVERGQAPLTPKTGTPGKAS